jgi:ribose/xylose/arabinose/galactoside ABC-type transport system permease subunit
LGASITCKGAIRVRRAAQNVLNLLDLPTFYQYLVRGGIVFPAVVLNRLRHQARGSVRSAASGKVV